MTFENFEVWIVEIIRRRGRTRIEVFFSELTARQYARRYQGKFPTHRWNLMSPQEEEHDAKPI